MKLTFHKPQDNGQGSGGSWEPLPAGTYDIQIDSVEPNRTSSGGFPQVRVNGHVVGGNSDGKKVVVFYTLAEKATWKFTNLLDAIGVEYSEDAEGHLQTDPDEMPGTYFQCDVTVGEWQNKKKNEYNNERPSPYGAQANAPAIAQPQTSSAPAQATQAAQVAATSQPRLAAPATAQALPQRRPRANA